MVPPLRKANERCTVYNIEEHLLLYVHTGNMLFYEMQIFKIVSIVSTFECTIYYFWILQDQFIIFKID